MSTPLIAHTVDAHDSDYNNQHEDGDIDDKHRQRVEAHLPIFPHLHAVLK